MFEHPNLSPHPPKKTLENRRPPPTSIATKDHQFPSHQFHPINSIPSTSDRFQPIDSIVLVAECSSRSRRMARSSITRCRSRAAARTARRTLSAAQA